eukprot:c4564_g1_i1 orf=2-238(-)
MTTCFRLHDISMDWLPPLQYPLDAPTLTLNRLEIGRIIQHNITPPDAKSTWISPTEELGTKMTFYRDRLLHLRMDGFIS